MVHDTYLVVHTYLRVLCRRYLVEVEIGRARTRPLKVKVTNQETLRVSPKVYIRSAFTGTRTRQVPSCLLSVFRTREVERDLYSPLAQFSIDKSLTKSPSDHYAAIDSLRSLHDGIRFRGLHHPGHASESSQCSNPGCCCQRPEPEIVLAEW